MCAPLHLTLSSHHPQVFADLAIAVVTGTILSSLAFAWEMSIRVSAPMRLTDSVHGYDAIGGEVQISSL